MLNDHLAGDAAIACVDTYEPSEHIPFENFELHGRGGTNFNVAFDWIREKQEAEGLELDVLFYLTDG